jgi:hypothetical protein
MPKHPYRIARQEHLGNMLDQLQSFGLLTWAWDYEIRPGRETGSAIYWVTEPGQGKHKLDTRRAEELTLRLCHQQGIVWLPVPPPGGKTQLAETLRKIEALKQGTRSAEATTATQVRPIEPEPFDLTAYPELLQRIHDEPSGDRSAQTFSATCHCIELGLRDGQAKWFLAQYPPFLDKYEGRSDADRELDRVVAKAREEATG